jgi:hypothetical protein
MMSLPLEHMKRAELLRRSIYRSHAAGCCLHIWLDDNNTDDDTAAWVLDYAKEHGHEDCVALAEIGVQMSKTQRIKLAVRGYAKHVEGR